ncbi:MAG: DNA repair protein [Deltaproteobacteria bacterium]|nr:MAG: DNA repair protein [Deltaproteobacteria bacterium]
MNLDILKLTIDIGADLNPRHGEKIRGYLGRLFWENPYAHNHLEDGKLIYRYPCVQYKVVENMCLVIGFNEGIEIIMKAFHNLTSVDLDGEAKEIKFKSLEKYSSSFSISQEKKKYAFFTPWIALNEKNYEKYQKSGDRKKRKELLQKTLIGNILSMSKGVGYTVPKPVEVNINKIREVQTSLKGNPMLGFLGEFYVNFEIPDYLGIGKSVSRGFGTVKKIR